MEKIVARESEWRKIAVLCLVYFILLFSVLHRTLPVTLLVLNQTITPPFSLHTPQDFTSFNVGQLNVTSQFRLTHYVLACSLFLFDPQRL